MTAGIFAAHGVFAGVCREANRHNRKGYFENVRIGKLLKDYHGAIVHAGKVASRVSGFRTCVETALALDGYRSGPWLWKGSALYWPAWHEFEPYFVLCRRPAEDIFRSCRSSPNIFGRHLSDDELQAVILRHQTEMDGVTGSNVDTKAVAGGDFSTVKAAIEACGLEFDKKVTREFVDPSLWKH